MITLKTPLEREAKGAASPTFPPLIAVILICAALGVMWAAWHTYNTSFPWCVPVYPKEHIGGQVVISIGEPVYRLHYCGTQQNRAGEERECVYRERVTEAEYVRQLYDNGAVGIDDD